MSAQTKIFLGLALQEYIWKNLGIICNYYCCNQTTKILFPAKNTTDTTLMPGLSGWGYPRLRLQLPSSFVKCS